jgi:hypothetical protein
VSRARTRRARCARRWAVAVTAALLIAIAGAQAAVDDRATLYRRGDLAALRRIGTTTPIRELIAALVNPDRATALAAQVAVTGHPDAVDALPRLARVAAGWDRSLAAPAATAARTIAATIDGDRAIYDDLDDDALAAATNAWLEIAHRADRWSDVRADAVVIATRLIGARSATATTAPEFARVLAPLFSDDDPEVRLAALESTPIPPPPELWPALIVQLAHDADSRVRLAAAQALCAGDAATMLATLDSNARDALRAVLTVDVEQPGALLDAARCVATDRDPRSQRAIQSLRHSAPRSLRSALAALPRQPSP